MTNPMRTDTTAPPQVTLDRNARLFRESLTRCRRDVSSPLKDEHVRNLIKRVEHGRATPCEKVVQLMYDAFLRGGSREFVEGPGRTLLAIAASWYDAQGNALAPDIPTLIQREIEAQAAANVVEMKVALDPTPKAICDAADLLRVHAMRLEAVLSRMELEQVKLAA